MRFNQEEIKKGRIYLVALYLPDNENTKYLTYPDMESFLEDGPHLRKLYPDYHWGGMYVNGVELSKYLYGNNIFDFSVTDSDNSVLKNKLSVLEQDYQRLNDFLKIVDSAIHRLEGSFVNSIDRDNTTERLCKDIGYFLGQLHSIKYRYVYACPEALYSEKISDYHFEDDLPF